MITLIFILIVIIIYLVYVYRSYSFFDRLNINGPRPMFFLGNLKELYGKGHRLTLNIDKGSYKTVIKSLKKICVSA